MSLQSGGEAVDQGGGGEGLGQEANGPGVQCLGSDALIGKGRDEDERDNMTLAAYDRHELRAAHNRHLHIRDHTRRVIQLGRPQELRGRRKSMGRVAMRPQKILRRATHRCIIINDGYNQTCCQSASFRSRDREPSEWRLSNGKIDRKSRDNIILGFVLWGLVPRTPRAWDFLSKIGQRPRTHSPS
jgi:hypothetical protein